MPFDYDGFWTEADGKLETDGWFHLPARLQKRDATEMKPNKRSMYRKRYAMLDAVSAQIHRALGADGAEPHPAPVPSQTANPPA